MPQLKETLLTALPGLQTALWKLILALVVLMVGKKLIRMLMHHLDFIAGKTHLEPGLTKFLRSLVKILLYAVLIYTVADLFGIPTASFIALLGSAGLTIGMALQGSLSNFAGGVLLLFLKPFQVGDYITGMVGEEFEGTVDAVDLFYTRVITADNNAVYIPNGKLADSTLINFDQQAERRLDLTIGVGYQESIDRVRSVITGVLDQHEKIVRRSEAKVFVRELGDSAVKIGVRGWVKREDYWNEKWSLQEDIKKALDEAGIIIPYPQLDVHLTQP